MNLSPFLLSDTLTKATVYSLTFTLADAKDGRDLMSNYEDNILPTDEEGAVGVVGYLFQDEEFGRCLDKFAVNSFIFKNLLENEIDQSLDLVKWNTPQPVQSQDKAWTTSQQPITQLTVSTNTFCLRDFTTIAPIYWSFEVRDNRQLQTPPPHNLIPD